MSSTEHKIPTNITTTGHKRKRTSQEQLPEEIAWTAARCNRLLRTISSRLSTLRRLLSTESQIEASRQSARPKLLPKAGNKTSDADPVWLPKGRKRTAAGRTYAGKRRAASQQHPKPPRRDEVRSLAFPSPFVKRLAMNTASEDENIPPPDHHEEESMWCKLQAQQPHQRRKSRQLPIRPKSSIQEAENGLLSAVATLLDQTKSPKAREPRKTGTRSLLSTCLRKVPDYIDFEAEEEAEQEDGTENTTSEVFTYLEQALGMKREPGWHGLRQVVQSQGLFVIRQAVEENLLSSATIKALVSKCMRNGNPDEGSEILQTWLGSLKTPTAAQLAESMMMCSDNARIRLAVRLMELEPANMTRISASVWDNVLGLLTRGTDSEACAFLISCAKASRALEDQGSLASTTLSAMKSAMIKITVMATATLLLNGSTSGVELLVETIHRIGANAACDFLDSTSNKPPDLTAFFVMCSQILLCLDASSNPTYDVLSTGALTTLLDPIKRGRLGCSVRVRNQQDSFASAFAEGAMELEKHITLGLIERLLDRILELDSMEPVLEQVAVQAILQARQSSDAREDQMYTEYLRRLTATGRDENGRTPFGTSKKPAGFRWEEGLCEWVTTTAFPTKILQESEEVVVEPSTPEEQYDSASPTKPLPNYEEVVMTPETPDEPYCSPRVIGKHASPDVLALSAKPKRRSMGSLSWKVSKRRADVDDAQPCWLAQRRKSSRISAKEDSGDELGF